MLVWYTVTQPNMATRASDAEVVNETCAVGALWWPQGGTDQTK